jgi:hypothetical protein
MKIISILVLTALAMVTNAQAQNLSPEVLEAGKRIDEAFDQNLKAWRRESVVPIDANSNVVVENWKTYDRGVRISIQLLPSDPKVAQLMTDPPSAKKLEAIGDQAVSWGYFGNVTFHHGRFSVSVSSNVDLNLLSQGRNENESMSRTEAAATSRLLACFVNLALTGDLMRGKPIPREGFLQRPCEQELIFKRFFGEEILRQLTNRY